MTPQEKAKQLVKKFHPFTYTAVHSHKTSVEYADAKKCALIAVDEILKAIGISMTDEYWQQVKEEIEKL